MISNPAFTKRNIQNANAYLLNILVRNKTLWSRITLYRASTYVFGSSTLQQRWLVLRYSAHELQLMFANNGNEFNHSIQQTFVSHERVTNSKERLRGRLSKQLRNIKVSRSVQVHWCVLQLNVCILLFWATRGRKEESLHIASKFQPLWMTTYSNWTCRLRILQKMMWKSKPFYMKFS